jgi:hypothetical protein
VRRGGSRGVVLANVMIMLTVMLLVVTAMLNLTMGRSVMIRKHSTSYEARKITESAMAVLQTCLRDQTYSGLSSNACSMSGPVAFGSWSNAGSYKQLSGTVTTSAKTYDIVAKWYSDERLEIICTNCM